MAPNPTWANKESGITFLSEIVQTPDYDTGDEILFIDDNPQAKNIIRLLLAKLQSHKIMTLGLNSKRGFTLHKPLKPFKTPETEFKKINPTKYRIRVHKVSESFPLLFNETHHVQWKAYLVPFKTEAFSRKSIPVKKLLGTYKILRGNKESQATRAELEEYMAKGWVTEIGDGLQKSNDPYYFFTKFLPHTPRHEMFNIDYISKNFAGTIQNDNLPKGNPWDTWFSGQMIFGCGNKTLVNKKLCFASTVGSWETVKSSNPDTLQWPDLLHWKANSLVNSWWFDFTLLKELSKHSEYKSLFKQNSDGSIDFEVVIEYWPQRIQYFGWGLTTLTLVGCFLLIFLRSILRRLKPLALDI